MLFNRDATGRITDIVDSLGRRLVRNIYNEDGRLIAQEDNAGNRTEFDHDLTDEQSFVTDRLGRTTFLEYDDLGQGVVVGVGDGADAEVLVEFEDEAVLGRQGVAPRVGDDAEGGVFDQRILRENGKEGTQARIGSLFMHH
ncbi:MAG: hypothetical protein WD397_12955 [Wenzhouxiangellaceae bacterium]